MIQMIKSESGKGLTKNGGGFLCRHPYLFLAFACLISDFLFNPTTKNGRIFIAVSFAIIAVGICAYLGFCAIRCFKGKLNEEIIVPTLIVLGFLLRLLYITYTASITRQHDVGTFSEFWNLDNGSNTSSHADYINWFFNNFGLPNVNPTKGFTQFYHPPLHHIIAGLWMRLHTLLGFSYERAVESIQILTLFYSSSCMITASKIFERLNLKGLSKNLSVAIIAFQPTFIIMAGSVNNDILSIALAFGAILATIIWYSDKTVKNILVVALCIGFSMMAKLSGGLVAPGIALVFLVALCKTVASKNKQSIKKIISQFVLFGVVCVPLGLWWQTRCYLKYGMLPTYVPNLGQNSWQYIGDYSVSSRLFNYGESLKTVFMAWKRDVGFNEYNCISALLKTSIFGEFNFFGAGSKAYLVCVALFVVNLILVAFSVVSMIYFLFFKKSKILATPMNLLMYGIEIVVLACYLSFCFKFPHTCTQNMRYAVPTVLVGVYFFGIFAQKTMMTAENSKLKKCARYSFLLLTSAFCVLSSLVFSLLGVSLFFK